VALAPGLERLSLELRLDRRRRAEIEARRVPVRLLAPLVVCVLPAFALLTVVPLLVASLRALPT
jgi:tight adherence protein C